MAAVLANGGGSSAAAAALVGDAAVAMLLLLLMLLAAVAPGAPAIVQDREDDTDGALAFGGVVCLDPFLPFSEEEVVVLVRGRQRRGPRGSRPAVSVVCCKTDAEPALPSAACLPSSVPPPQIGF